MESKLSVSEINSWYDVETVKKAMKEKEYRDETRDATGWDVFYRGESNKSYSCTASIFRDVNKFDIAKEGEYSKKILVQS